MMKIAPLLIFIFFYTELIPHPTLISEKWKCCMIGEVRDKKLALRSLKCVARTLILSERGNVFFLGEFELVSLPEM